jgi:hypothetical protein
LDVQLLTHKIHIVIQPGQGKSSITYPAIPTLRRLWFHILLLFLSGPVPLST